MPDKSFVILLDGSEESGDAEATVELAKNSTLSDIPKLHERLKAVLESGDPVSIDIGAVADVDTAVLQLLCSFVLSAKAREIDVQWQGKSDVLSETAHRLGLDNDLSLQ